MAKADIYWSCKSVYAALHNFATAGSGGGSEGTTTTAPEFIARLWQIYRQGTALCHLFNLLRPETPIDVNNDNKKVLVYKFLLACRQHLHMRDEELFTVSELYQDNANGLAKATYTANKILCRLRDEGTVDSYVELRPPPPTDLSVGDKVVRELLETERKYVQDLETLQEYARELQTCLSLDTLHIIFGNLHALIDFQLRFLLHLEYYADEKKDIDSLGKLFVDLEDAFSVYEPYCAHLPDALEAVLRWTPQLQAVSSTIEPTYELQSFLIKPVQRVCKYPLLVQQLVKNTSSSAPAVTGLADGLAAIQRVASKVNETRRLQENQQIVQELRERVVDWRGIVNVDKQCGALMLHDRVMVRHKSDTPRQVQVYLFEKMLLVCKDVPKKAKKKSLQAILLAGLINISNIAQVDVEGDEDTPSSTPCLRIFFTSSSKLGFDLDSFTLEFLNCEQLRQWDSTVSKLIHQQKSNKKQQQQPLTPLIIEPHHQTNDQEEPLSPTFLSYVSMNKLNLSTTSSNSSTTSSSSYYSYPYTPSSPCCSFETPLPTTPTSLSTTCSTPTTTSSVGRRSRSQSSPNIALAHEASAKYYASRRVVESDPLLSTVKVKLHCNDGIYVFFVPRNIYYDDLRALIERKLRLKRFGYIKYRDEDGDLITMHCDEDVSLAFDLKETRVLHLYITDL